MRKLFEKKIDKYEALSEDDKIEIEMWSHYDIEPEPNFFKKLWIKLNQKIKVANEKLLNFKR